MDAADWDERYQSSGLLWTARPNVFLVDLVDDLSPGRSLDLAGGEGRTAVFLASRGFDATSVDFSSVACAKADELARQMGVEISTVIADVTEWEPAPETFDLVTVLYLQLPEPSRSTALVHAIRSVTPGGSFIVIAHDVANVTGGVGGPPDEAVCYHAESVTRHLDDFEILEAGTRDRLVDGAARPAIDTVVHARRRVA